MNILFMCVANSARSQMAEGLARLICGGKCHVESAGSQPKTVNPLAMQAMNEIGVDLTSHYSKSFDQLDKSFRSNLNYIITLCAEEVCPVVASSGALRLHWPLLDPANDRLSEEEQLNNFCLVRDQIKEKLIEFFKLKLKK